MKSIKSISQRVAGVVLNDGCIIDGNRRYTCLRKLYDREHDKVDLRYKDDSHETSETESSILSKCGHVYNYTCYVDSDKCCLCDKNMIMEMIN